MTEPLIYEAVQPGVTIGPDKYRLPSDFNVGRLASLGMTDRQCLLTADGREVAEPSILCGQHSWTFRNRYHWTGSVHAKCEVEFLAPTFVGTEISVTSYLVDKYERRGGRYVVLEMETRDENDRPTTRVRNTMLLNYADVRSKRNESAREVSDDQEPQESSLPVHMTLGPKRLGRDELIAYFNCEEQIYGPLPSIHNDASRAHKLGLPDIIAPGRYMLGLLYTALFRFHGTGWLQGSRFAVSIRNNVAPGLDVQLRNTYLPASSGDRRNFSFDGRDEASDRPIVTGTFSLAR
jgi:hypothetical protein